MVIVSERLPSVGETVVGGDLFQAGGGKMHLIAQGTVEPEELVRAIDFMSSAMEGKKPAQGNDRTEMRISTRDGFEVGVRFAAGGANPFVHTPSATFAVQRATFEALRAKLDEGREHLFSN